MAKVIKKKDSKVRPSKYEEKVLFDGTFEDMIGISVKDAEKRIEGRKNNDNMIKLGFRYKGKDYQFEYRTGERVEGEGAKKVTHKDYYVTFKSEEHGIDIQDFLLFSINTDTLFETSYAGQVAVHHYDVIAEVKSNIYKHENGSQSGN